MKFQIAPYNPRKISSVSLDGLRESLRRFGDISGIVLNRRTGNLVAGHQRLQALGFSPDEVGARVASIAESDTRFHHVVMELSDALTVSVRIVDWDDTTEKAANVAANNPNFGGDFTRELLAILEELRIDGSFEALKLDDMFELIPPIPPEEFPDLIERMNEEPDICVCACGHEHTRRTKRKSE